MVLLKKISSLTVLSAALLATVGFAQHAYAADAEKGKTLFATLCATCHGNTGAGDGPVAASLPPEMKPRNLQEGVFKYATDDAKLKEVLKKGGAAVGLSPMMTGAPGATDEDLDNLAAFVKSLKK